MGETGFSLLDLMEAPEHVGHNLVSPTNDSQNMGLPQKKKRDLQAVCPQPSGELIEKLLPEGLV